MLEDRYGNSLSTKSSAARDAYVDGVDRYLAAEQGTVQAFEAAIALDEQFALAHVGLARACQITGDAASASAAMEAARTHAGSLTEREGNHIAALGLLIDGKSAAAYKAIRAHLETCPRDVMAAQTCTGVFGLIGFSGLPGREAEQLAFTSGLVSSYADDWWFLAQHAFAQVEAGQTGPATDTIERSLAGNPRNANGAHIRAHIYYEAGETEEGISYVSDWLPDYAKGGTLHCHISWHVALWALECGDIETMWNVIDTDVAPGKAWGPALNVLTDNIAILYRAELAGEQVTPERWQVISEYALNKFPNTGIALADVHAALAHAKVGNSEALEKIIAEAKGPAGNMVRTIAEAFQAIAVEDWPTATDRLITVMARHEQIGGSRAQRDLIEYTLLGALVKQGLVNEAKLLLAIRRPLKMSAKAVKGL
ncbi:MAG: tetratricopeptide repeat protein [Rhodospirillales bacterium]|jgi:hypothetical protein|nr:tetratricopeptide repeat protein [Rhodospirillales bacterium]MBT5350978.1 tetratricopeptide repeat protein [Rhodospirillales bacterium]MBT5520602.1 tetratricopeptide repeat protein [Rhodospirillales bacterium]MBT6111363.1 tetratricopeptide repeat protein [Rhodospirillales bacterium]MBT7147191.1 tetratricopeptide repeat protein [Rhodospirillales bacterium]